MHSWSYGSGATGSAVSWERGDKGSDPDPAPWMKDPTSLLQLRFRSWLGIGSDSRPRSSTHCRVAKNHKKKKSHTHKTKKNHHHQHQKSKIERKKTNLWLPKGKGVGWIRGLGLANELCSIQSGWSTGTCWIAQDTPLELCDDLYGKWICKRMTVSLSMTESLCCTGEITRHCKSTMQCQINTIFKIKKKKEKPPTNCVRLSVVKLIPISEMSYCFGGGCSFHSHTCSTWRFPG